MKSHKWNLKFYPSDEEWERTAKHQKELGLKIANKVEAEEVLKGMEAKMAAALIRAAANSIPNKQPKRIGAPPKFSSGEVVSLFLIKTKMAGKSNNKAHEELAEQFDVSTTAIKKCLEKYAQDVDGFSEWITHGISGKNRDDTSSKPRTRNKIKK